MISIITIVNRPQLFEQFKKSLSAQVDVNYELIEIDNTNNQYSSARKAYDDAVKRSRGEYLLFIHPDIRFENTRALSTIMASVQRIQNFGIIGIAGCPEKLVGNKRVIYSNIVHGTPPISAGRKITEAREVQTVDECFFIVSRNSYNKIPFSHAEGWHLYAVEICLQYLKAGYQNYVVPADIWHLSAGKSLDYHYVQQLKRLIKKYKEYFPYINTTVKKWGTRGVFNALFVNFYLTKQYIKNLFGAR